MAEEVSRGPDRMETLRAADADRHQIAVKLKVGAGRGPDEVTVGVQTIRHQRRDR
jgi:hypothetical protein